MFDFGYTYPVGLFSLERSFGLPEGSCTGGGGCPMVTLAKQACAQRWDGNLCCEAVLDMSREHTWRTRLRHKCMRVDTSATLTSQGGLFPCHVHTQCSENAGNVARHTIYAHAVQVCRPSRFLSFCRLEKVFNQTINRLDIPYHTGVQ